MDFGFVLVILFYYSHFIHRFKNVSAAQTPFEIIRDRERVEEHAVEYSKYKRSWRNSIKKQISVLPSRRNICERTAELKVAMCDKFLPLAYMGYAFDSWSENDLICTTNTFRIRHLRNEETDSFDLEMYPCPNIKYRDLETDLEIIIPDKYYVSEGKKHDSAILFFQSDKKDEHDRIYAGKYMNNIVFEKLIPEEAEPKYQLSRELTRPRGQPDREMIQYAEAQTLRRTYTKFQRTFRSINLCGLPRSHKIHLCREEMKLLRRRRTPPLQLDVIDQLLCRRHRIHTSLDERDIYFSIGENPPAEMHFHLLLCPQESTQSEQKEIPVLEYVFSNLHSSSITLLTRFNKRGSKFGKQIILWDLDIDAMVKDRRRVRKMKYPSEVVRKQELMKLQRNDVTEFENEHYWMMTSVQTPITMAKASLIKWKPVPAPITITRREPLVEDILISYSKIKARKFAYNRFIETYRSLDICSLPHRLKEALCHKTLHQSPFEYYPSSDGEEQSNESSNSIDMKLEDTYQVYPPDRNINRGCSKQEVNLGIREIQSLKAKYFSMWRCPKVETTNHYDTIYYIAKYHLKNALLVFRTCDARKRTEIIFPEAVVTEIDREDLARIVLNEMTEH